MLNLCIPKGRQSSLLYKIRMAEFCPLLQETEAIAANVACSFGAALLFVLCNPWTGRPELRHINPSLPAGEVGAQAHGDEAKVDLSNVPDMNGEMPPGYNGAEGRANGEVKEVKNKSESQRYANLKVTFVVLKVLSCPLL